MKHLKRFVYISSTIVYGYPKEAKKINEDSHLCITKLSYNSNVLFEKFLYF